MCNSWLVCVMMFSFYLKVHEWNKLVILERNRRQSCIELLRQGCWIGGQRNAKSYDSVFLIMTKDSLNGVRKIFPYLAFFLWQGFKYFLSCLRFKAFSFFFLFFIKVVLFEKVCNQKKFSFHGKKNLLKLMSNCKLHPFFVQANSNYFLSFQVMYMNFYGVMSLCMWSQSPFCVYRWWRIRIHKKSRPTCNLLVHILEYPFSFISSIVCLKPKYV
jgi:hypothetical protein